MALRHAGVLSENMALTQPALGAAALIAAGLYQWTPLKHRCLSNCRSPLGFIMSRWRDGPLGAWKMGLEHGSYCVGCCWLLMLLLFVVGVMNLAWVIALSVFVLLEKMVPGEAWSRLCGLVLVGLGLWWLV